MADTTTDKPLPQPRGEEADFFAAARAHRLAYQRCRACDRTASYPRVLCPHCGSLEVALLTSEGRGVVHAFTTQMRPGGPGFAADVPYTLALVDLEEGFRGFGDLVGVPVDEVRIGLPVQVVFDDVTDDVTLPRYTPRTGEGS
ncbi:Zn-ribbon domain-containing OB-fold protein [Nocardioides sp. LHG3406-4]|uniref:Zn-ribbon domain-containing OB-fold protein n=1 Tax=Nocardioides sp. LHG3406-4 TaxID=2804575 RepID=UPI003CF3244D